MDDKYITIHTIVDSSIYNIIIIIYKYSYLLSHGLKPQYMHFFDCFCLK